MSAEPESKPPYSQFDPVQLREYIALLQKGGSKNFVTFLIGAGCSKSAGIPLAGEIVRELREEAKVHPLLRAAGSPPATCSEYAFLMEKLGSPKERAQRIKKYVDRARDENGRLVKLETVAPLGSFKLNEAIAQAFYSQQAGAKRIITAT